MLTADPPAHTRYRKLAAKAFTFKRVEQMGAYVARVADQLIDGFAAAGACEFKSAFANHLPMIVIADALGVPRADMDRFHRWSDAFVVQLGGVSDRETRLEAARRIVEFQRYFVGQDRGETPPPRPRTSSPIWSMPISPRRATGARWTMPNCSRSSSSCSWPATRPPPIPSPPALLLIENPGELAKLRADPELVGGLVEETLRYLTPTNNMWRLARRDAEIGGVPVKAGELILLRYGSGNRDAAHFDDPDRFDIARADPRSHLAFGAGIHTCIGASLARKEMAVAFPILLDRLRNLRFQEGAGRLRYNPNILLRGVLELHVAFDPA